MGLRKWFVFFPLLLILVSALLPLNVYSQLCPLPALTDTDIAGSTGSSTGGSGSSSLTVTGTGSGITYSSTSDQFHFTYIAVSGDLTITGRVSSLGGGTLAYLMIRQGLNPGDMTMAVQTDSSFQAFAWYRTTTNAGIFNNSFTPIGPACLPVGPVWLKIIRLGNNFFPAYSCDGVSWTFDATQTIVMSDPVYVGLGAAGGASYVFDSFCPPPPISPTFTATGTQTYTATETLTPSKTFTPSQTFTPSTTGTQTYTSTLTQTSTDTLTPSQTYTPSLTLTSSQTYTVTYTLTPSQTLTPSFTLTSTLTFTITNTVTLSPTITNTPVIGPLDVRDLVTFPNPAKDNSPVTFYYYLTTSDAEQVSLKIYTTAMRLIRGFDAYKQFGPNYVPWDLRDNNGDFLANGLYFYRLDAVRGRDRIKRFGKLVVLHQN